MAALRSGLLREIVTMSIDTLRASKMRSALTVLGVVIGIMSIVGMTSLIRGFDESLRDSIRQLGPNTVFIAKFSGLSIMSGKDFVELLKRPNLTAADARAISREAPSVAVLDIRRRHGPQQPRARVLPQPAHPRARHLRRDRELQPGRVPRPGHGPILQRRRAPAPPQRRRPGADAVPHAVRRSRDGSDRQESAGRRGRVHGDRGRQEAAESGRLQPRRRRFRGDPVHGAREAVRQRRRRARAGQQPRRRTRAPSAAR